jgi:carbamoyltransferase
MIRSLPIEAIDFGGQREALYTTVAERMAEGKIVGWFQGRAAFGPRALGGRSILADPRRPEMQKRLNQQVKRREEFRPFAPCVLREFAADHFDLHADLPFMIETCRVTSPLSLPAVTHIDGSARPQTVDHDSSPYLAGLLAAFYRLTGCPILLNTSFNLYNEPIVCTPIDALFCFVRANLDLLVLDDFVLEREKMPENLPHLLTQWQTIPQFAFGERQTAVPDTIYTFV